MGLVYTIYSGLKKDKHNIYIKVFVGMDNYFFFIFGEIMRVVKSSILHGFKRIGIPYIVVKGKNVKMEENDKMGI